MTWKKNYFCSYKGKEASKKYNRPDVPVACDPINYVFVIENIKNCLPFISILSTIIYVSWD